MKIEGGRFSVQHCHEAPITEHPGETGMSTWQTLQTAELRSRIVEYSPGYVADHWCRRGHIVFVISGELVTELEDGRTFTLPAGSSYQVADGVDAHRSRSPKGARLFIAD